MTPRYYNETTQAFIVLSQKKKKKKQNTFGNDYFYPCRYFPPRMHLSEILRLHVQVRAVGSG